MRAVAAAAARVLGRSVAPVPGRVKAWEAAWTVVQAAALAVVLAVVWAAVLARAEWAAVRVMAWVMTRPMVWAVAWAWAQTQSDRSVVEEECYPRARLAGALMGLLPEAVPRGRSA